MSNSKKDQLHLIGKIKDAHGLKGEVLLIIFSKDYSPWQDLKFLHLGKEESAAVSYTVEGSRQASLGLILRLKGISDRNQSELLKGKLAFVSEEKLVAKPGERIFLKEIIDFQVFNRGQLVGRIKSFSSNGPQDLLVVESLDYKRPVEIPFVEKFIVKLDMKAKTLKLDLPDGLLEINEEDGGQ